jgi:hypothetical protein
MILNQLFNEGVNWHTDPEQQSMDATRRARLGREREPEGSDAIDAQLAANNNARQQYAETGRFWLKQKDTQQHLNDQPYTGKAAANAAAVELLKQQPELRGNLVITAYGPGEQQPVSEGKVKELGQDLKDKALSDDEFKAKYGKTRAEVRAAMREQQGVAEGIMNKIADKVMGAAPEQPKYKVGQQVKYETSPHQPDWKDGGSGVGVITDYKNGHYMINGNPVNHFEIKGVVDQGVAEGNYDRDDYYNARQGREYGRDLTATGYGGDSAGTRRDDIFKGQSKNLPADPFRRTSGAVPYATKGQQHRIALPGEVDEGEKVGNMDADAFDAAMARLKKLAGSGPMKTVYDPNKRVYRNVPTAVQPGDKK